MRLLWTGAISDGPVLTIRASWLWIQHHTRYVLLIIPTWFSVRDQVAEILNGLERQLENLDGGYGCRGQ